MNRAECEYPSFSSTTALQMLEEQKEMICASLKKQDEMRSELERLKFHNEQLEAYIKLITQKD